MRLEDIGRERLVERRYTLRDRVDLTLRRGRLVDRVREFLPRKRGMLGNVAGCWWG